MTDYIADEKNSLEYTLLFSRLKKNREKKKPMMIIFPFIYER
jgi:hypothetical protein